MTAPKKIYIGEIGSISDIRGSWHERSYPNDTEYIRADLVEGMRLACEAMVQAYPYEDKYDGGLCLCDMCQAYRLGKAALKADDG